MKTTWSQICELSIHRENRSVKNVRRRWCWDTVCQRISFYSDDSRQKGSQYDQTKKKKMVGRLTTHARHKDEWGRGVNARCCSTNLLFIISRFSSFHNGAQVTWYIRHLAPANQLFPLALLCLHLYHVVLLANPEGVPALLFWTHPHFNMSVRHETGVPDNTIK